MIFTLGLLVLIADAGILAWPLYATWPFAVATGGAVVLAFGVGWLSSRAKFPWFVQVLVAVLAGVVAGGPLTHADRLGNFSDIALAYAGMLRGLVSGWKELLTVPLPAGSYQDVLVPWFVIVYASVLASLALRRFALARATESSSARASVLSALPAAIATLPLLWTLAFSSPSVSSGGLAGRLATALPALAGAATTIVQILLGLMWLTGALLVARGTRRRSPKRSPVSLVRRMVTALSAVLVIALAAGVVAVATVSIGIPGTRVALRQDVEPAQTLALAPSPLSVYRNSFVNPDLYAATTLTYSAPPSGGDGRIRLAVLPYYDGQVFSASSDGQSAPEFQRLPVPLPVSMEKETLSFTLAPSTASATSGVSPWLAVPDNLSSVTVQEAATASGSRELYVNAQTQAAVLIESATPSSAQDSVSGLTVGAVSYEVVRGIAGEYPSLSDLARPDTTGSLIDAQLIPAAMSEWMRLQGVPVADGAGLAELVDRLRARGYLSHALVAPTTSDSWMTRLASANYVFQPSLAGHSVGRLDQLFEQLVEKQREAPAGASDDRLVAAVGDNEQFAAAVAILAMANGFPARVVTGYVTGLVDDAALSVAPCADGVCRGANLTAWVEVQGANGSWAAVDVDPQFENPVAPRSDVVTEPQIGTSVTNDTGTVLPPGAITPQAGTTPPIPDTAPVTFDWVLPLLRIIGIVSLVVLAVCAPFLAILAVKASRRRARRRDGNPRDRIVGAWEEYLDAALDLGLVVSPSLTRREVATALDRPQLVALADGVDTAVFGTAGASDSDAEEFWRLIEGARLDLEHDASWWRIATARLSLASFLRYRTADLLPRDSVGFVTLATGETDEPNAVAGFTRYVTRSTRRRLRRDKGE